MTALSIPRPSADESVPYYHRYIAKVPSENLGQQLTGQLDELEQLLEPVTDRAALARYADGKWSVKEVIGHLSDAERIFSYRLFRIGRGDETPLAGFDEKPYVPAGKFDRLPLRVLLDEFRAIRMSTAALMVELPPESWTRRGTADGNPISVRALAYIIIGHANHHMGVLRELYGL
jgi:DinB family protein